MKNTKTSKLSDYRLVHCKKPQQQKKQQYKKQTNTNIFFYNGM